MTCFCREQLCFYILVYEEAVWLFFVQTQVCWQRIRVVFRGGVVDEFGLPDEETQERGRKKVAIPLPNLHQSLTGSSSKFQLFYSTVKLQDAQQYAYKNAQHDEHKMCLRFQYCCTLFKFREHAVPLVFDYQTVYCVYTRVS